MPGYRVAGKTGTAWKSDPGRLFEGPLPRRVRRRRAGERAAPRGPRHGGRAAGRLLLRRRRRGARLLRRRFGRAAPDVGRAGRPRARDARRATRARRHERRHVASTSCSPGSRRRRRVAVAGPHARFARGRRRRRLRRAAGRPRPRPRARRGSRLRAARARSSGTPRKAREPGAADAAVPFVAVTALRDRLGGIADRFYGMPSSRLTVAGVTGTNGKTTCAWLLASAAGRLARRGAYLGTLGAGFPPRRRGRRADHAGRHHAAPAAARARGRRRDARRDGGVLARARPAPRRRRAPARRRVQQPARAITSTTTARWSATPRRRRGCSGCPGLEHAVINVGDPVGARFAAALPAGVELTAVAVGGAAPAAARFVHVGRIQAADRGLELDIRGHFGERRLQLAADRRVQRREPRRHARRAAGLAVRRGRVARGARRLRRAARAAWRATACRTARSRSSTTRTRRTRSPRRSPPCARTRAAACWSCSAAAASAIPASAR